MAILNLLAKQTAENGIAYKFSKDHRYFLKRSKTSEGFEVYLLENSQRNEKLIIQREIFDRFRSTLKSISDNYIQNPGTVIDLERKIFFKNLDFYKIRPAVDDAKILIVQELVKQPGSGGYLSIPLDGLAGLVAVFYHPKLQHTNDVFDRLVRYHRLFHFSFTDASESITSGLSLRKDVLSQIDEYVPALGAKSHEMHGDETAQGDHADALETSSISSRASKANKTAASKFKSRLGQRDGSQRYDVDYAALFQSGKSGEIERQPKAADDQTKRGAIATAMTFPLPLLAGDIKSLSKLPFRCELSLEEATGLRENFLQDRDCELFLGFEIIDSIFRSGSKLKSYRFPLYYMKVRIEESGRFIHISPADSPEIFLNHLSLAVLVESFGPAGLGVGDPVQGFFETLLSQKIEVQGRLSEIKIHRLLPVTEEVFDRTRDILLGLPGENGRGGILANLESIGLECDVESVVLYKAPNLASPVSRALEQDVDHIQELAHNYPDRFYRSLLGHFLTPEMKIAAPPSKKFCEQAFCPEAQPKSMRKLFDRLNLHDLVLLEGPPGTGKTYAIMNLFIHCLITGKKLLIVSDQKAAIHALTEKIYEFLNGKNQSTPLAKTHLALYRQSVKLVDQISTANPSLPQWMATLSKSLGLDEAREQTSYPIDQKSVDAVIEIDGMIEQETSLIRQLIEKRLSGQVNPRFVASKFDHPTTQEDIKDLICFLDFIGAGQHANAKHSASYRSHSQVVKDFISDREILAKGIFSTCYHEFSLDQDHIDHDIQELSSLARLIESLLEKKPRTEAEIEELIGPMAEHPLVQMVREQWRRYFPVQQSFLPRFVHRVISYFRHPSILFWQSLLSLLSHQKTVLEMLQKIEEGPRVLRQLQGIHEVMHPDYEGSPSLALESSVFTEFRAEGPQIAVQTQLLKIKKLQAERDALIKDLFLQRMSQISEASVASGTNHGTSPLTTITNLVEALKDCSSIDRGVGVSLLRELQEKLVEAFPVWICRKQAVSFLFPSKEHLFDLVIIDEAGQCRVDDAIPLLFRAKKLMVVGDDKQTVLNRNSVIDDYLFKEFNLEDHLSQTQSRGMKGGGSHIFGLVKSIKQAEVMLDEHYRCPPDIIRYSNEYVYGSNLKIMQWRHPSLPPSVVVDYSEKQAESNIKATSGKFKDIETELVDRYLEFVIKTVKRIEKETGHPINMETDVALCYFLLKNEPYIKEKKAQFLAKLNRGHDVLDGAGAALQGKERNYIFYLWDVSRPNMKSFRQGDDPDKRKGEMNVLMSRPKIRAYHYLHPEFESLKHETATITDYLWKIFQQQHHKATSHDMVPRTIRPGSEFRPWQRSSGELMRAIMNQVLSGRVDGKIKDMLARADCSVVVGDSRRKVDLMLLAEAKGGHSIGLVDLSAFENDKQSAQEVIDYFFQLQRAVPPIEPVFLFLHELADERSAVFQYLLARTS